MIYLCPCLHFEDEIELSNPVISVEIIIDAVTSECFIRCGGYYKQYLARHILMKCAGK